MFLCQINIHSKSSHRKHSNFWLSKSIFYVKSYPNLSFHWRISIEEQVFGCWHFQSTLFNWNHAYFLIAWFRADVNLTFFLMKKCYLPLDQAPIWCWSYWKNIKRYLIGTAAATKPSTLVTWPSTTKHVFCISYILLLLYHTP